MARSIVVKGVESPERLLDETSLFLHRVITDLPSDKQRMLERLNSSDEDLVGQTALLVDDQPAKLLSYEVILRDINENLIKASSGREALEHLLRSEIAVVLMDV